MAEALRVKTYPEGWVVAASHQLEGRGSFLNLWEDQPGKNILMSIYLKPDFLSVKNHFDWNRMISVSVASCFKNNFGIDLKIKWPNDFYAGEKKIGGLLIENVFAGLNFKQSIVGIGINLNQTVFSENLNTASSIINEFKLNLDVASVIESICKTIEVNYLKMKACSLTDLNEQYQQNLFGKNQLRQFKAADKIFEGEIEGVDDVGNLMLRVNQSIQKFEHKQIVFLFNI